MADNDKTRVTGIRLTEGERAELKRLGNGSFSLAIRDAIDMLFRAHKVKQPAKQ